MNTEQPLISIVAPIFNEEQVIDTFYHQLCVVLDEMKLPAELIFVDDGSRDNSADILNKLQQDDPRIAIVQLSRNFGKEIALTAGLDHSHGDAVIVIDTDLQDPPELIPQLIEEWRNGYDVVYAQRLKREGESWFKKMTAHNFYRLIRRTSDINIPADTGDFRLLSRRAVEALGQLRERHRFMKGLFTWIGYPQKAVKYNRQPRRAGHTKWNYWKLWNFALEGITSFSTAPLRLATYFGLLVALFSFIYGAYIIYKTLAHGNPVPGYPSLMVVILFLGGIQLIGIGIIGEYLGRLYDESKQRPLYLLKSYHPADAFSDSSAATRSSTGTQSPISD
jgi:glycosyltransferase involved in cell wall biosynthesis